MPPSIDDLIPNAKQIQKEAALKEAEKADEYVRLAAAVESEKLPKQCLRDLNFALDLLGRNVGKPRREFGEHALERQQLVQRCVARSQPPRLHGSLDGHDVAHMMTITLIMIPTYAS